MPTFESPQSPQPPVESSAERHDAARIPLRETIKDMQKQVDRLESKEDKSGAAEEIKELMAEGQELYDSGDVKSEDATLLADKYAALLKRHNLKWIV